MLYDEVVNINTFQNKRQRLQLGGGKQTGSGIVCWVALGVLPLSGLVIHLFLSLKTIQTIGRVI